MERSVHRRSEAPKLKPAQEAHLVELWRAGTHTSAELTELFSVARSTVVRAVQRAGEPKPVRARQRRHIFVEENKRAGYVIAAVTFSDTEAVGKIVRALVLPGQRRIHMKHEQARRRRVIVSALAAMQVQATVYVAATVAAFTCLARGTSCEEASPRPVRTGRGARASRFRGPDDGNAPCSGHTIQSFLDLFASSVASFSGSDRFTTVMLATHISDYSSRTKDDC